MSVHGSLVEAEEAELQTIPRAGVLQRFGAEGLRYAIPATANRLPYMLGGLTFAGITLLILTGIILDQFYDPTALGAHNSLMYIMTRVPLGNWLRAVHYWAATIVLISVTAHLILVFARRGYARPREVQWWSGVALLLLFFGITFTGTVLRADQEGGEALAHALAGAELFGRFGNVMSQDFAPSTTLLSRMHNTHVSLLPLALIGLIVLHFWLIRQLGIHAPGPKNSVFTAHLQKLSGFALLLIGSIALLAAVLPPGLGHPAVQGVEVTKPFWPFLWIYSAENTFGMVGMIIAPAILFAFLALVPLLDRNPDAPRPRWLQAVALIMLVALIGSLVYGHFAPQMQHLGM